MTTNDAADFFTRLIERQVNEKFSGDATIRDIVALMIAAGWRPPADPVTPQDQ